MKLREELRESETRTQDLNHGYSALIKEKEDEVVELRSQLESVLPSHEFHAVVEETIYRQWD